MMSRGAMDKVPGGWLRVVEQARVLGVHPDTLLRLRRQGLLPKGSYKQAGRVWFFNPDTLSLE